MDESVGIPTMIIGATPLNFSPASRPKAGCVGEGEKMKKSVLAALVCTAVMLAPASIAQESLVPISITPDVIYGHKMGMALTFDVLRPANANGAGVMFMVSGGWFSRHSPPERTALRFTELLGEGFTVFAVRHGSAPLFKVPEAVDDVAPSNPLHPHERQRLRTRSGSSRRHRRQRRRPSVVGARHDR